MNTNTDRNSNQTSTWSFLSPDDINRRTTNAYRCSSRSRSGSGSNQRSGQSSSIPSSAHTPLRSLLNSPRSSSTSLGIHHADEENQDYLEDMRLLHEAVEVLVDQVHEETSTSLGTDDETNGPLFAGTAQDRGDDGVGLGIEWQEEIIRAPPVSRDETESISL